MAITNKPLRRLLERAKLEVEDFDKVKDDFVANIQKEPIHTLEWSHMFFEKATSHRVWSQVQYLIETKIPVEKLNIPMIKELVSQEMTRRAMYPSFSSSPTSNLVHLLETSAWAKVYEYIKEIE